MSIGPDLLSDLFYILSSFFRNARQPFFSNPYQVVVEFFFIMTMYVAFSMSMQSCVIFFA